MTALVLAILSNPTLIAIIGGIAAALGFGIHQRRAGAKAERNANRAKEADAYEKHLQDIERAAAAKPRVGVSDDPHNRDNE